MTRIDVSDERVTDGEERDAAVGADQGPWRGHALSLHPSATYCYSLRCSAVRCNPLHGASPQVSSVVGVEFRGDEYVWRQVADELKRRIEAGQYRPGAPLPSERRLAEELGVAVGSIRRATAALVEEGVLRVLPRKGVYPVERED